MSKLVYRANVVKRGASLNAESTPVHSFAVLYELHRARHVIAAARTLLRGRHVRLYELGERNLNRRNLSTALSLGQRAPDLAALTRLVATRIYLYACLRALYVFATHQMRLIHILANVNQIVSLIQTVNVDNLDAHLLNCVGLRFCVEGHALANRQVRTDGALELVLNHKVDVEVKFNGCAHLH